MIRVYHATGAVGLPIGRLGAATGGRSLSPIISHNSFIVMYKRPLLILNGIRVCFYYSMSEVCLSSVKFTTFRGSQNPDKNLGFKVLGSRGAK